MTLQDSEDPESNGDHENGDQVGSTEIKAAPDSEDHPSEGVELLKSSTADGSSEHVGEDLDALVSAEKNDLLPAEESVDQTDQASTPKMPEAVTSEKRELEEPAAVDSPLPERSDTGEPSPIKIDQTKVGDDEITQEIPLTSSQVIKDTREIGDSEHHDEPNEDKGIAWFGSLEDYDTIPILDVTKEPALPTTGQPEENKAPLDGTGQMAEQGAESEATRLLETRVDVSPGAPDKEIKPQVMRRIEDDIPTLPPPKEVPLTPTTGGESLPKPVTEMDWQATRVTPAAYAGTPAKSVPPKSKSTQQEGTKPIRVRRKSKKKAGKSSGCSRRVFLFMLFIGIFIIVIVGSIGIYQYFRIASSLPDVEELRERVSQFETTRILDRNGNVLYEIIDPNAGKRTFVPLEEISPYLIAATIATEDKEYYNHPGFDPVALVRALYQNYVAGEIVSGASTITQQLARMLLLPDERFDQSYSRKAREIILAAEIDRRYSKEDILELYLNEIFYGNLAYGIEAAAETYFDTTSDQLTLWQASFLAGLPQAPSVYDIYNNREATLARNRDVLVLMYEMSQEEENCIYVSTNQQEVCVDAVSALQAAETLEAYEFNSPTFKMTYPHWVVYVQSLLEAQYDPQTIYRSGFTVYTTLDPELQKQAELYVRQQVEAMAANNASNGAVVAMKPATGEILAMVGSADFYNESISGQVNMALTETRQPGSAIKPITYLAAFEKGWTPSTLIWDVPSDFPPSGNPDDQRPPYQPVNYDGKFHGPVTVRTALANSYNIPAVKTLAYVGIYDDPNTNYPDGFIETAKRLGITSLTRDDYGLSLTLGGGEVSLLEMTGAYSVLANSGRKVSPVAITKIVDHSGSTVYEYQAPSGDQIVRAEHAYLLSMILSDTNARIPAFGTNPVINLPFQAAAKTGTTNDFRDNWTIGYTPDLVVGVWVGNADYTPMVNTSGLTGAAPIWANVMQFGIQYLTGGNPSAFSRPAGIVDRVICSISGTEPSEWCPEQRSEIFASDQLPLPRSADLWAKVNVDTWTGLLASADCNEFVDEKFALNVSDNSAIKWLTENDAGRSWLDKFGFTSPIFFAPSRECTLNDSRPIIEFHGIGNGQTINVSPLDIVGVIDATSNFKEYRLDYGIGENPNEWEVLVNHETAPVRASAKIYEWDLTEVKAGVVTLRITIYSTNDTQASKKILLTIAIPTPTATSIETPTMTPTMTPTPTDTPTLEPTNTPTPFPTDLPIEPTNTPTFEPTETSTDVPTETPTLEPTLG